MSVTPAKSSAPIPAWTPGAIRAVPSSLRSGLPAGVADALRGRTELGNGQQLSAAQVATLSPYLAERFGLPASTVRSDLEAVRLYVGGPAAGERGWAVTLGRDVYVTRPEQVERMLSWEGRRWLVHELGHTMQWRRTEGGDDVSRTRRFLGSYAAGGPGAAVRGTWNWVKERGSIADAVHDAHGMEREAEAPAREFAAP